MEEQENPIVARTYRCDRCGQLMMFDLAALSASKLHSSPAVGEVAVKPNCSLCGAPLGDPTFRNIIPERPPEPEPVAEPERSWIGNATHEQGDTPANPTPVPEPAAEPVPELVPTPAAAEPIPLEQATTKQPEPEPVL